MRLEIVWILGYNLGIEGGPAVDKCGACPLFCCGFDLDFWFVLGWRSGTVKARTELPV